MNTEAQSLTEFIPSATEDHPPVEFISPNQQDLPEKYLLSQTESLPDRLFTTGVNLHHSHLRSPSPAGVEEPLFLRRSGSQFPVLSSGGRGFIFPYTDMAQIAFHVHTS